MGVRERLEAKRNKNNKSVESQTSNSGKKMGVRERVEAKRTIGFDTLESDLHTMGETLNNIYGSWQTKETMDTTFESVNNMYTRLGKYQDYYTQYGKESGLPDLSELLNTYKGAVEGWGGRTELYGHYQNADAFNKAVKDYQLSEKFKGLSYGDVQALMRKYSSDPDAYNYLKNYTGYTSVEDFDKAIAGLYDGSKLLSEAKEYEGKISSYEGRAKTFEGRTRGLTNDGGFGKKADDTKAEYDAWLEGMGYSSADEFKSEMKATNDQRKALEEQKKLWMPFEEFKGIEQNADFGQKSGYVKKDVKYESAGYGSSYLIASDEDAHKYNLINGDKDAQDYESLYNVHQYGTNDDIMYEYLEPEEKQKYNYLWETQGPKKANQYADALAPFLRERRVAHEAEMDAQMAKENPFATSVVSVFDNVGNNMMALPMLAADALDGDGIDENSSLYRGRRRVNTERSTVEGMIDSDIGKFFYRHGLNTADNLATMAVSGFGKYGAVSKVIQTGIMSSGAFVDTTLDAKSRGLSDEQALTIGAIAGAAEYYFESKGFESMFGGNNLSGGAMGYFVDNLKTELVGELGTELTNDFADFLVAQDMNKWKLSMEDYAERGYSESEALSHTIKDYALKYADVAAGTLFSSGVMTAPSAIGVHSQNKAVGKSLRGAEQIGDVLNIASMTPEESEAYEAYTRYANKGVTADNITDAQLGNLYNTMSSDVKGGFRTAVTDLANAHGEMTTQRTTLGYEYESAKKDMLSAKAEIDTLKGIIDSKESTEVQKASASADLDNAIAKYNEAQQRMNRAYEPAVASESLTDRQRNKAQNKLDKAVSEYTDAQTRFGKYAPIADKLSGVEESVGAYNAKRTIEKAEAEKRAKHEAEVKKLSSGVETSVMADTDKAIEIKGMKDSDTLITSDGEVKLKDVELSDRDADLVAYARGMEASEASLYLEQYKGEENIEEYTNTFSLVTSMAKNNYSEDAILKAKGSLSTEQFNAIYAATVTERYREKQRNIDKLNAEMAGKMSYKGVIDDSVINYGNKTVKGKVKWSDLNSRQREAVTFISGFAKATGMNLKLIADGERRGINGSYDKATNTITIDVYAGISKAKNLLKDTIIPTMSHEITHWMKEKSPELYRKIGDLVFKTLEAHDGISEVDRVASEVARHNAKGRNITDDGARDEIIARACEDMLKMSEEGKKLFNSLSESEKKTFIDKVKEILANLMEWVDNFLNSYSSDRYEAKVMREYKDTLAELSRLWDEMLVSSVKNNSSMELAGVFGNKNNTSDGEVQNSIREEFASEIDEWKKAGMPDGETFSNVFKENVSDNENLQFSMRDDVEETKDLIAVHNLTDAKLRKAFEVGGFPMPSIAVTKANMGHDKFGDISLVFYRDTIDPAVDSDNKLYGGDAYTPTFPAVRYEANRNKVYELSTLYDDMRKRFGADDARPLYVYSDYSNAADTLNRNGGEEGVIDYLKGDTNLMQLFLLDKTGNKVDTVMKRTEVKASDEDVKEYEFWLYELGKDFFDGLTPPTGVKYIDHARQYFEENKSTVLKTFSKMLTELYGYNAEEANNAVINTPESEFKSTLRRVYLYNKNGSVTVKEEPDYTATRDLITKTAKAKGYDKWVEDTFKGIEGKKGIRNDKDPFTPSGKRRSFEDLHFDYTLDNIVRAMKLKNDKGISLFGGSIVGASAKNYKSVDAMKADSERLKQISQDEYDNIQKGFRDRFRELAVRLAGGKDSIDAGNLMAEAVAKYNTPSAIKNYIARESKGIYNYTDDIGNELLDVVNGIANMPTGYFEAKPKRAVGFDEVATAIIPNDTSAELKAKLEENNVPYIEYEKGNEQSRLDALNSLENVQFSDRDDDISVFEKMGEAYRLEEENAWLKEDIKWLKERVKLEGQVTNGKYFKDSSIVAAAEVLLKKVESKYDKVQLARSLRDLYHFIRSAGSEADADVVMQKAHDIARQILSGAKPMVVKNDYYAKLLSEIKKTRVRFNKNQKAECSARIGKNWNRSFFGKIILADDARTELDQQWKEWAEEYPDIFDAHVKDGDQPMELYEILTSLKANSEIVEEYNNEENAMWLVKEILNQYWNLTPLVTTADKYSKQIKELTAKHRQKMKEARDTYNSRVEQAKLAERMFYGKKMSEMRKEYDAKLEKQRKTDSAKMADKLAETREQHEAELYEKELAERMHFGAEIAKLRRQKDEKVAEAKELGKQKMADYRENIAKNAKIKSITSNVLDLNDKLVKNSKDKHIPEAMKDAVGELLRAIDFSSKRKLEGGEPTKKDIALEKALGHLKDAITDGSKEIGDILDEMYRSGIDDSIKELVKSVDKHMSSIDGQVFTLNEMTLDELNKLDSIVKIIKATANKVNKFHVAQHNAGVQALGVRSMEEIDSRKKIFKDDKKHFEKMKTSVFWNNLNPFYAFKNLGEASQKIFTALQDGQDKLAFLSKEVIDFADSVYSAKDYNKWKDTYFEFEVAQPNGKIAKFSMNVPQIMSLYCVTKQEDARTHILHGGEDGEGGGITIVETDKKEAVRTNIRLTEADLNNIISKLDGVNNVKGDKTAKGVADELQEFMCRRGADLGNEISMARWDIKSFGITNYFPIKVSEGSVPMKNDAPGVDSVSMLELLNMSFTHARNHFAKQSVEIGDVFDVFSSHMSNMARYNAMALPILDMYKWMNSRVKDEYGAEHSVQTSIKDTFGEYAWKYFGTLLKDISGGTKKSTRDKLAVRFFKNAKVAKVAANIRVVALQFTSYIRAGAVMDNKYLLKALNYFSTRDLKDEAYKNAITKAKKYCGIALWKSMGYYDTDITRGLTEQIKHSTNVRSKLVELSLKGAEWADETTWGMMWNACEFEIRDKHPELKPKTEEYYKAVGERLRDVIYRTQVVDSMLTRSQMMRSPDAWDKVLTMFGSESTLSLNLAMDVFTSYELDKRSLGKEKAKAKNKKYIRKAITAYIVTNVVTSALQTLFDAFRDYDEDEKDEEYLTKLMLENFLSNSSIINKIPYLNAFSSIISGFTPSRTDVDWMNDSVKAVKAIYKCFAEGKSVEPAIKYTLKTLSDASGIAGYNLYRDIYALYELFNGD